MICTSIQAKDYKEILSILETPGFEMLELRLDSCRLSDDEIKDIFAHSELPLIACCRGSECLSFKESERRLSLAIEAGAMFVDLELEAPVEVSKNIQRLCREKGTKLIRSYHNYTQTPDSEILKRAIARCFRYGADVAKLACMCNSEQDSETLRNLYSLEFENIQQLRGRLVAFGMREHGRESRLYCLRLGAPFTYASLKEEEATAPGQWTEVEMRERLYSGRFRYEGTELHMPASKSFAQRAIVAASLAEGTSILHNYSPCEDCESAIKAISAIGAKVERKDGGTTLEIEGIAYKGNELEIKEVACGESGLLTRLLIPLLSAISSGKCTITGQGTLLRRPLHLASDIMASFGVLLSNVESKSEKELFVPINIQGKLVPGFADISGNGGSQLISGLLMALPLCDKDSSLHVNEPKSIPYMYITLDVLRHFGIKLRSEMEGDAKLLEDSNWDGCNGISFKIQGQQRYKAAEINLEGDWSAAANFLVAGAIFGKAETHGLEMNSLQADLSIVDVLVEAGASVSSIDEETQVVCSNKAPLEAFDFDLNNAPDLFPITAVLAAFCEGESRIHGTKRLTSKESDRASAIIEMLSKMGVEAGIEGDTLTVYGESLSSRLLKGRMLKGGDYTSHHDHRMAMALEVASLGAESPIVIDDRACVGKSFPEFFEMFSRKY